MGTRAVSDDLNSRTWPRMPQQLIAIGFSVRLLALRKPSALRRSTINTKRYGMLVRTEHLIEQRHAFYQPSAWICDWRKIPGRHNNCYPRGLFSKGRRRDDLEEVDQLHLLWGSACNPFRLGFTFAVCFRDREFWHLSDDVRDRHTIDGSRCANEKQESIHFPHQLQKAGTGQSCRECVFVSLPGRIRELKCDVVSRIRLPQVNANGLNPMCFCSRNLPTLSPILS